VELKLRELLSVLFANNPVRKEKASPALPFKNIHKSA
jgi:hypothetical protein